MDSFELNKIIGAILGTLLFVMASGFLAEAIYSPIEGRGPGYELPEPESVAVAEAETTEPQTSLGELLANASAEQGAAAARKCQSCHNFEQGAGNKQGPELYGVVGRLIASFPGFAYSEALAALGAAGEVWSYENLDHFIAAPKDFAPGTKMNFGGVKDPEERANILAYLASITPDAPPFPAAEAVPDGAPDTAEGEVPPAEGATEPVPSEADAVATPTETQSETPVEGTPTTSGTEGTAPIVPEAAPAEGEAPVVPEVPAQ